MVPLKLYVWDPNKVQRGDGRASPPPPPPVPAILSCVYFVIVLHLRSWFLHA